EAKELLRPGYGHVYKLSTDVGGLWSLKWDKEGKERVQVNEARGAKDTLGSLF
ncbi:hypothetical protein Tco_1443416, partial [Tanacetum coccineum]